MEVVLGAVSLVPIRVLPSAEVITPVVSSVVPSSWHSIPVDIHWDRSVVHPPRGIG